MKKLAYLLLPLALILGACGGNISNDSQVTSSDLPTSSETSSEDVDPFPEDEHHVIPEPTYDLPLGADTTVYFVVGKDATLDNKKGVSIDKMYLENTVMLEMKVGDDLPGASRVRTTVKDVVFDSWQFYNAKTPGAPTLVDKAPNQSYSILQPKWKYVGEDKPIEENAWYVVGEGSFITGSQTWDISTGIKMMLNDKTTVVDGKEYMILDLALKAGDLFKFTNGDVWISNGWQENDGAFADGNVKLVNDGQGGFNAKAIKDCSIDVYLKVYNSGNFQCYIGTHK